MDLLWVTLFPFPFTLCPSNIQDAPSITMANTIQVIFFIIRFGYIVEYFLLYLCYIAVSNDGFIGRYIPFIFYITIAGDVNIELYARIHFNITFSHYAYFCFLSLQANRFYITLPHHFTINIF